MVPGLGAPGYLLDTLERCGTWSNAFLLDVPGYGHDEERACRPRIKDLSDVVAAWIAAMARLPVVLVGHSTGAQVALRVAVDNPGSVRSLVLMGPTFPPALRRTSPLLRALARTLPHESAGEVPAVAPYYARAGAGELVRYLRSAQRDEPERLVPRVTCPVWVVRGAHDALAPRKWVDELAAHCPRGQTVTMPGAHNFPYRHSGHTAALIAEAAAHR
ncbi:alpha/beta hydrolase [Streptomyces ficellus]|uniref:Alpha/beta hydrolase n=1 Tax=Streptomyces ficellus TaxID=1977088 RepID=A0ABT7ZA43_9ACTN|nr:alpha/beta hydrolase [Streptomyces ficellus]MDN3296369.1 alpha/beta hydrolase [Streptomyces ficellus]